MSDENESEVAGGGALKDNEDDDADSSEYDAENEEESIGDDEQQHEDGFGNQPKAAVLNSSDSGYGSSFGAPSAPVVISFNNRKQDATRDRQFEVLATSRTIGDNALSQQPFGGASSRLQVSKVVSREMQMEDLIDRTDPERLQQLRHHQSDSAYALKFAAGLDAIANDGKNQDARRDQGTNRNLRNNAGPIPTGSRSENCTFHRRQPARPPVSQAMQMSGRNGITKHPPRHSRPIRLSEPRTANRPESRPRKRANNDRDFNGSNSYGSSSNEDIYASSRDEHNRRREGADQGAMNDRGLPRGRQVGWRP
jgi:hypothetical protein